MYRKLMYHNWPWFPCCFCCTIIWQHNAIVMHKLCDLDWGEKCLTKRKYSTHTYGSHPTMSTCDHNFPVVGWSPWWPRTEQLPSLLLCWCRLLWDRWQSKLFKTPFFYFCLTQISDMKWDFKESNWNILCVTV